MLSIRYADHVGTGGKSYFAAWYEGRKAESVAAADLTTAVGRLLIEQARPEVQVRREHPSDPAGVTPS